jgi:hypothetical protein
MRLNVQCHTTVILPPRKRWGAHYTEGLWTLFSVSCCWQDAVCSMIEWMKWISKTREINYPGLFILIIGVKFSVSPFLCLSLRLSVCLSVCLCFLKVWKLINDILPLCWLSCLQLNSYSNYLISVVLAFKNQTLLVPLHESPVVSSVLTVFIQTPETYLILHSSALQRQ